MRGLVLTLLAVAPLALAPSRARAAGGHDKIGCIACHGLTKAEGTSSFCLSCHSAQDQGGKGILPIDRHVSHPYDIVTVNPRIAKVPPELLRADGRFDCLSCHDPHPSNASFAYLRTDAGPRARFVEAFCAVCHPAKSAKQPAVVGGPKRRR